MTDTSISSMHSSVIPISSEDMTNDGSSGTLGLDVKERDTSPNTNLYSDSEGHKIVDPEPES